MRSLPTPLVEQGQGEIFKALVQSVVQEERVAYKGRRVVYCSLAFVLNSHSISCRLGQRDDPSPSPSCTTRQHTLDARSTAANGEVSVRPPLRREPHRWHVYPRPSRLWAPSLKEVYL